MRILLALVSATWLVACGQTGPLRLPEAAPAEASAPAPTTAAPEAAKPKPTTPSP